MVLSFYIYCKKSCPRRVLSASKNYRYFVENGLRPVGNPKKADLIVIHSCGGFNQDERFSLLTLEKALEIKSKSSKVIMTGCLPKINKKALLPFKEAIIIPTEDLKNLDSLIGARIPFKSISESSIIAGVDDLHGTFVEKVRRNLGFNRKAFAIFKRYLRQKLIYKLRNAFFDEETYNIIISKGCLGNCTYCAIKFANPIFNSYPEEQIIEEFRFGLKHNYKHFTITACDIGAYGIDIGTNLSNLLEKLFAVEGNYETRLSALNARWFVKHYKDLFFVLKKNAQKISKIILPIQSGSNRILGLMKRHYTIDEVKECISDFQERIPSVVLETQMMVGFPGETESDFQMSRKLLRDLQFSKVQIYKYEDRPGTIASKLPNKVSDATKNKRAKILARGINAIIVN